ncbi:hypothetical protein N0V88_002649 [Collariella sp. IMI 366227]|nr:hypothetical protein N0V88_002649 [Collariella sp. IMI 366227]
MVSFFGLKFGDKKKKSESKPAQSKQQQSQQWKRVDQDAMGEGQFFGKNIRQQGVINGSIRSVSRAGTPQPTTTGGKSPYKHDTHNLAAASMFDLGNASSMRSGSQASLHLKPHASDANLRNRFGAQNGSSSTNLALPTPGFSSRLAARNGSSSSLAAPPPLGSRPGTPSRNKQWVNPLDVHFVRSVPTGPPTPKSPLLSPSVTLPPTPSRERTETGSVFGEDAHDMVDTIMASVKKREQEEKEAKEKENELERQRETARLEMQRLERQKSTESNLGRPGSAPRSQPESPLKRAGEPSLLSPVKTDGDSRPGSRGCALHHCIRARLPRGLRHNVSHSHLAKDNLVRGLSGLRPRAQAHEDIGRRGPRATSQGQGLVQGTTALNPTALALMAPTIVLNPETLAFKASLLMARTSKGFGPLSALADGPRSPSPPLNSAEIREMRLQNPTLGTPPLLSPTEQFYSEPELLPSEGRKTSGQETQTVAQLISTLTSPSTVTSPSGSIRRLSLDDGPIEQFARPIIQNVWAKRDTMTLNTPRKHSLSMRIEELEKSLIHAQQGHQTLKPLSPGTNRISTGSSFYSDGTKDDDDDDDGPILPIQPAPLRVSPPLAPRSATVPLPTVSQPLSPPTPTLPPPIPAMSANRPQSPFRGPPRRGVGLRRPGLEEYGISSNQVVKSRGGTPTPASRSGSADNYSTHSSPPSRTNTPQLRHPNWRRDMTQPSPVPTVDAFEHPRPSPRIDTGFNFGFGPGASTNSTTWSMVSPTNTEPGPTLSVPPTMSEPAPQVDNSSAKFTRAHVPPPLNLKFNFSPTPPHATQACPLPPGSGHRRFTQPHSPEQRLMHGRRPPPGRAVMAGAMGNKLAASPRLISQFSEPVHDDDHRASFMGIGMARGPSIKEVRRPKTSGASSP